MNAEYELALARERGYEESARMAAREVSGYKQTIAYLTEENARLKKHASRKENENNRLRDLIKELAK